METVGEQGRVRDENAMVLGMMYNPEETKRGLPPFAGKSTARTLCSRLCTTRDFRQTAWQKCRRRSRPSEGGRSPRSMMTLKFPLNQ